jgi:hypothetical protein
MSNLNQIQKEVLKTVTNVEKRKNVKKLFQEINKESAGLTDDQKYCIENADYTDDESKKLTKIFREANLRLYLNRAIN